MKTVMFAIILLACTRAAVYAMDVSCVTNELSLVTYLQSKSFPTNDLQLANADLWPLRRDLLSIMSMEFMPSSTNSFLAIADFVSQGELFSVSNRVEDIRMAHLHDNFIEFGTSNTVSRAGGVYHGPTARACMLRYNLRMGYNSGLEDFRISTLRDAKYTLTRSCWQGYTEGQRAELFAEFCRRIHATEEELQKVREANIALPD